LLAHHADEAFHRAVRALYEQSHVVPITDDYGYNPREGDFVAVPVRDVMVALQLDVHRGDGEFAVELTDGAANYTTVFDCGRGQVRLYAGELPDPVAEAAWPKADELGPRLLEVSLFDQQVLVACDGQPLLGPWAISTPSDTPAPRSPARFGATRVDAVVGSLVLYRDVHYTSARSRHGIQRPYELGDDELFVLGDNSPVSHDSRRWADGAVPEGLLVGKPFVVHLPSKPGRMRVGSYDVQLRLPDWERIRLLP
jgi:hypothetical protein